MLKLRRVFFLLWIMIVSSCMLVSCDNRSDSVIMQDSLVVCAEYSIPGTLDKELKGKKLNGIEEDSYGRILYQYTARCGIHQKNETFLVICQKYTSDRVFFYEDVNYLELDDSSVAMEEWKAKNDWERPLNDEKMSERSYDVTFDHVMIVPPTPEYRNVRDTVSNALAEQGMQLTDCYLDDVDPKGTALYVAVGQRQEETTVHFFIVNASGEIVGMQEYANVASGLDLHTWKEASGWEFGLISDRANPTDVVIHFDGQVKGTHGIVN